MSKDSYQLIAASYPTHEQGDTIFAMIRDMASAQNIKVADVVFVEKTEEGKLEVKETKEFTSRKGARRGALILGTIGLIYPPSFIATVVMGGGFGALAGKLRDTGIKSDELERFAQNLEPGHVAVLVLSHSDSVSKVTSSLQGYEGMIVTEPIDPNATARMVGAEPQAEATESDATPG